MRRQLRQLRRNLNVYATTLRPQQGTALLARAHVAQRFQRLLASLQFSAVDVTRYNSHMASVTTRLATAFHLNKPLVIGSAARGSAIRQDSDVDLMSVFKMAELRCGDRLVSSYTLLNRVRQELQDRFWNTDLGRDGQAITVRFRDGQYSVDVVPAGFWAIENNSPVYLIPDGTGNWMKTSPRTHNAYIAGANLRSANKLKYVAQLAKHWRFSRGLPLNSFHVEMLIATTRICDGAKTYAQCMTDLLDTLRDRACRGLQDPKRIAGLLPAANTDAKLDKLFAAVDYSAKHARAALRAEEQGATAEAIRQWNIVFNDGF